MGAAKGNSNALKHGFYSRAFHSGELADLEAVQEGLESEIAMLRIATRRMFEIFDRAQQEAEAEGTSLKEMSAALNGLGLANIRIASLLRSKALLSGQGSSILSLLREELSNMQAELGITP